MNSQSEKIDRYAVRERLYQVNQLMSFKRLAQKMGVGVKMLHRLLERGGSEAVWARVLPLLEALEGEIQRLRLPPGKSARQMSALELWPPGVLHDSGGLIL